MPLRQSVLNFKALEGSAQPLTAADEAQSRRQSAVRAASSSASEPGDAIRLARTGASPRPQLPTPSETSVELSSQTSDELTLKEVVKPRLRRTSRRIASQGSHGLETSQDGESSRTVSGETLVNEPSDPAKQDPEVLDFKWAVNKADLLDGNDAEMAMGDTILMKADDEEMAEKDVETEKERLAKAAARKSRTEEKKRVREARYSAADSKATRRSSRASLLSKAGNVVAGLAATVLGKRKSRVDEAKAEPGHHPAKQDSKRRRLSHSEPLSVAQTAQSIKCRQPRDKKWLNCGLYAGQPSNLNASALSGSRSKRKSLTALPQISESPVLPLPMFAGERLLQTGRDFKLPFDIFSPLPPGQPKPDEWRKSNRNTFVGDAQAEWRTSKFVENSTCMCKPDAGCGEDCMNRFMYYECDEQNCKLEPDQCGNRAFADLAQRKKRGDKYSIGVEVIKTVDRGYGVRSNRSFEPNQIIVEYSGEILTQEECEKRMRDEYKHNECYYLMNFDQNMVIDATTKGSIARFVNHSCAPNCRMEKWTVGGQPRMALFAGEHGVMTGEELSYDYNFDPYSQKNVQECRCGEENCRGVLGPKQQKPGKKDDATTAAARGIRRRVLSAGRATARLTASKKKTKEAKAVVYGRKPSTSSASARANKLQTRRRKLEPRTSKLASASVGGRGSAGLERSRPSKLRQAKAAAVASLCRQPSCKRTSTSTSTTAAGRVVSAGSESASRTLLDKEHESEAQAGQVRRSTSLRDRVKSMTRSMNKRV
ncbi:hypothetical protein DV735_g5658, partial [Chaetothyriales sp. CBS 134920]